MALFGTWFSIHFVTLVLSGLLLAGIRTLLQSRGVVRVSVWSLLAIGAVIGFLKGVSTALVEAGVFGQEVASALSTVRLVGAMLVGALLISGVSLGLQTLENLGRLRDELVGARFARRVADEQRGLLEDLQSLTRRMRVFLPRISSISRKEAALTLRELVEQNVRPLSQALWEFENRELPRIGVLSLWKWGNPSPELRSVVIGAVWASTTLSGSIVALGGFPALEYSLVIGLGISLAHLALRGKAAEKVLSRPAWVTGFGVITVLSVYAGLVMFSGNFEWSDGVLLALGGAYWHVILIIGVRVGHAVWSLRQQVAARPLASGPHLLAPENPITQGLSYREKKLSRELHGRVQGRLLALAREAELPYSAVDLEEAIRALVLDLESITSNDSPPSAAPASLAQRIGQLIESWEGIVDVTIHPEAREILSRDEPLPDEILEIVREALTNSFRHGGATEVLVELRSRGDHRWEGRVSDNGYGPLRAKRGLGSEIFDAVCDEWELRARPEGGAQLVFQVSSDSV